MSRPSAPRPPWILVSTFVALSVAMGAVGWGLYRQQRQWLLDTTRGALDSGSRARAAEVLAWRQERLADGRALQANPEVIRSSRRLLSAAPERDASDQWDRTLALVLAGRDYLGAVLVAPDGRVCRSVGTPPDLLDRPRLGFPTPAFLSDPVTGRDGRDAMFLWVPLAADDTGGSAPALVGLAIDPARGLESVVRGRTAPASHTESFLVRAEPDGAVVLSTAQRRTDGATGRRVAAGGRNWLATRIAAGQEGVSDGPDFSGAQATSAIRAIGDTGWRVVVTIPWEAQLGSAKAYAWRVALLVALVVATAGTILLLGWQRKQAALYRRLAESESSREALAESFDHLTRFGNDIVLIADVQGVIVEANERAVESYGYTREELVGMPVVRLREPGGTETITAWLERLDREGEVCSTHEHVRKDGTRFPVEVRARRVRHGGRALVHGVVRDITERVAMEQQLRETAERYRMLFEKANDAIVVADANTGEILEANRKAAELLGRPVDDLRGRHHTVLHPPGRQAESIRNLRARMTGEETGHLAVVLCSSDGREIPAEVSASRVEIHGRPAIVGIFRDLTERMAAEQALRRSEESHRVAAEQTGQLLYDVDTASGRIEWRGAIQALTGYSPEEYASVTVDDWAAFVHPDERDAVYRQYDEAVARISELRAEYRYRRKDGSYFLAEDLGVCLPAADGRHLRMVGTIRDVTASRAAEEELRQSEMRRQKLESLALLAGGIAHDFNNLLTGIVGNISLAVQDVQPSTEAHSCLLEAERACSRAQALTRQLLTFSKGGAPIKTPVNLATVLHDTASFACRGTGVRCEVTLSNHEVTAEVDEGQISQVIHNISLNAVQAMPAGGVLTATAGLVTLGSDNTFGLPAGPYARLALADTGVGIPAALLDRVFDPYFTTKQKGSGLGLAISHSIVSRHGGSIGVKSKVGEGTEFEVLLPASPVPPASRSGGADVDVPGGGRVLVMDDEEQVRQLAVRMVTRLGFDAVGVADGIAAVQAYRDAMAAGRRFDVVIMDLTIAGGMGGQEAVREVLAIDPTACVVVSSGYSNDPVMASYREHGFAAVLAKPYLLTQVKETLALLHGGTRPA